jgi:hypothetical protein
VAIRFVSGFLHNFLINNPIDKICDPCDYTYTVNFITPYLKEAIQALEKHQKAIEKQLNELRSLAGGAAVRRRREFSEETKRKMSLAQRRRWKAAKQKNEGQ